MARSRIIPLVVSCTVDKGNWSPMEWRTKESGKPTKANLEKWVKTVEESCATGANKHLGPTKILTAKIVRQKDGETMATYLHLMGRFAETCLGFQEEITKVAQQNGKSVEQVYGWWREYEAACHDQSTIVSELKRWYADKLEALYYLPITEARPELIRVVKLDGWFAVQSKRPATDRWIALAEHRTFDEAVKVADGWYAVKPATPTDGRYLVKCDDCKTTIRKTDDVRESYAGGQCGGCVGA